MSRRISDVVLIIFAMIIGAVIMLAFPAAWQAGLDEYDSSHPVWTGYEVQIVERGPMHLTIDLTATKMRDCDLRRVWGQVYYGEAASTDAGVSRIHGPVGMSSRPLGRQHMGAFVIAPVPMEASEAVVWVEHECVARVVRSQLARVKLK